MMAAATTTRRVVLALLFRASVAARLAARTPSRHLFSLLLYHHSGMRSIKVLGPVLPAQASRMRTRRTRTTIQGGRSGNSNRSNNYYHHNNNNQVGDNSRQSGFNSKTSSPTFAILRCSFPRIIRLPRKRPRSHFRRSRLEHRLRLVLLVGCGGWARIRTSICGHLHQLREKRFGAAVEDFSHPRMLKVVNEY